MSSEIHTPPATPAYRDGFERTFGEGIPEISEPVKKMLYEWKINKEYNKVILFFVGTCNFAEERAEYLLEETFEGMFIKKLKIKM